jgi:hypothetical protein
MVIEGTTFGVYAMKDVKESEAEGWEEVIGDRKLKHIAVVESGDIGDINIGWLEFEDGTIEIGEQACMRPYTQQYFGTDRDRASFIWLKMIYFYFMEG